MGGVTTVNREFPVSSDQKKKTTKIQTDTPVQGALTQRTSMRLESWKVRGSKTNHLELSW